MKNKRKFAYFENLGKISKNPRISNFVETIQNCVSGRSALLKAAYLEALLYSLRNYINQL